MDISKMIKGMTVPIIAFGISYTGMILNDLTINNNIELAINKMNTPGISYKIHNNWIDYYNRMYFELDDPNNYFPYRAVVWNLFEITAYKRP